MILLATLLGILLGTWCDSVGDTVGESVGNFVGIRWETRSVTWLENLSGNLWAFGWGRGRRFGWFLRRGLRARRLGQ